MAATLALQPQSSIQWAVSSAHSFRLLPRLTDKRADALNQRFAPTAVYRQESIQGFAILINPAVFQHPAAAKEVRKELNSQLLAIVQVVPAKPLLALRKVRIWVEWEKQATGAATFHPSAEWLKQNGDNPDKAGCVEVSNLRNFVRWSRTQQPWMVLHELAHAYHYRVLGDGDAGIAAAYQHAIAQKLYESVDYVDGDKRRAYALTNAREYFAELSEAYFGKNDFYPFTRVELKRYDPVGYQLMERVWGKPRIADLGDTGTIVRSGVNSHQSSHRT
ncbi:MAG: hypothetical protein KME16_25520 [Scytolyngbya sp. HA4215-MV1]|jgi:hypothetical protein|nr:hypothetical protein [Scytolyngbya sp. HA4215-MV1]